MPRVARTQRKLPLAEIPSAFDSTGTKTVDLAAARSDLDSLLQLVAEGESVQILTEKKTIANLVPAAAETGWQDSWKRLDEVWGSEAAPAEAAAAGQAGTFGSRESSLWKVETRPPFQQSQESISEPMPAQTSLLTSWDSDRFSSSGLQPFPFRRTGLNRLRL